MKPPLCVACHRDHRTYPGLKFTTVVFARTAEDEGWYRRAESEPGFVGQPPNVEWFCEDHVARGHALTALSRDDALAVLAAEHESSRGEDVP